MVLGAGPAHAFHFATFEYCKERFSTPGSSQHVIAAGAAGACATLIHDAFMTPFDGTLLAKERRRGIQMEKESEEREREREIWDEGKEREEGGKEREEG